jgi:ABC-3C biological conflict system middle component
MILPSKHLSQDRAQLTVGARILQNLSQPKTVSALWEEMPRQTKESEHATFPLSYDNFVLALDLLFLMGAIELEEGLLKRCAS